METVQPISNEIMSFPIRTLPSVLESHQIGPYIKHRFMDFTIGQEFHPAPKTVSIHFILFSLQNAKLSLHLCLFDRDIGQCRRYPQRIGNPYA